MRRGDKPCQYLVMNRMAVDLNVLGAFIEGQMLAMKIVA